MQSGSIGSTCQNHIEFKSSTPSNRQPPYAPYMMATPYIVPSSYVMPYLPSLLTSQYIELLKIQQIYSEWINTLKTAIIESDEEALQLLTLNYPNLLNYFSGLPLVFTAGTFQLDPAQYFENFHLALAHNNNAILLHMLKYNSQTFRPYLNRIDFKSQVKVLVIIGKHADKDFFEEYIGYIDNADVLRKVSKRIKISEPLKTTLSHKITTLSQNQHPTSKIAPESMTAHDANSNLTTQSNEDISKNNSEPAKETDAEQSIKSVHVAPHKKRYMRNSKVTKEAKKAPNKKLKTPSNSYTKITQAMPKVGNKTLPSESPKEIIIPYLPQAVVEKKFNQFLKAMQEKNDITYRQIWRDYPQIVNYIENLNDYDKELKILMLASQANKCAKSVTLFILVYLKSVRNLRVLETYLNYETRFNVKEALKKQIAWLKETALTKADDAQSIPTIDLFPMDPERIDPLFDELPIKFKL